MANALLAVIWFLIPLCCLGKVVITGTLPHGDFVYDPRLVHNQNGSVVLHQNAVSLGHAIAKARPELIFLSTPHGLEDTNDFMVYRNTKAAGFAELGDGE